MVSKGLEPREMASSIPWFLVIEALGHIKQVDPAHLVELVRKTPDISDDLGRNAREVVSLRILEKFYDRAIRNKNNRMPPPGSQIRFDPTDKCENVLSCILQGTSEASLKSGGPEILKWDIHSFIMHKRSELPRPALLKLKDGILAKSSPLLASLKDRSGLAVTNESQGEIPTDDGDLNVIVREPEGSHINTQAKPIEKLDSLITEKEDEVLQEVSPDRNLLSAKRPRCATHESQSAHEEASKKLKQDFVCTTNVDDIGDSSAGVVDHIQEEGYDLEKDTQIQHNGESNSHENKHNEDDASRSPTLKDGVGLIEVMHSQQKILDGETEGSAETSGEVNFQENCVDEAKGNNEGSVEPPSINGNVEHLVQEDNRADETNNNIAQSSQQNAADNGQSKHCDHPEILSDGDEYHDERIDIATKKNAFLNSQCTYTQDSLGTQLNICLKCNKSGHLLSCSSNTCPLVVHESCLGCTPHFDGNGSFYCPFCAYSRAISEYMEAKKKVSLARKDMVGFIGLRVQAEAERVDADQEADMATEVCDLPRKVSHTARGQGKEGPTRHIACRSDGNTSYRGDSETGHRSDKLPQTREPKVVPHQSGSDPPRETTGHDTDAGESSEEESERIVASKYSIRFRKQGNCTSPVIPQERRKKLPWTKEEEEKLKEGVQKIATARDRNIPWRKILEFGGDVFHKGRTSIDLKDKWRNICRGSPRCK